MTPEQVTDEMVSSACSALYEASNHELDAAYSEMREAIAAAINASGCVLVPRWLVFNVGCIECEVSSNVVGLYASHEEAESVAALANKTLDWREGGQNSFEVFDLLAPQADEYRAMLAAAETPAAASSEREVDHD